MLRRDRISSKYPLFLPRRKKNATKTLRRDIVVVFITYLSYICESSFHIRYECGRDVCAERIRININQYEKDISSMLILSR